MMTGRTFFNIIAVAAFLAAGAAWADGENLRADLRASQKACVGGDGDACLTVADAWDEGVLGKRKEFWARLFYRKACAAGEAQGCHRFAELLCRSGDGEREAARIDRYHQRGCDLEEADPCGPFRCAERAEPREEPAEEPPPEAEPEPPARKKLKVRRSVVLPRRRLPMGPPPMLVLKSKAVFGRRLPAVSRDGRLVAFLVEYAQGEESGETVKLLVKRSTTDEVAHEEILLSEGEILGIDISKPELVDRIEKANAYLAGKSWLEMKSEDVSVLDIQNCDDREEASGLCRQQLEVGPVKLRYLEPELTVNGQTLEVRSWTDEGYCAACGDDPGDDGKCDDGVGPDDDGCTRACLAPAYISLAAVGPGGGVLLLAVEYNQIAAGCTTPVPRYHVFELE